MKVMLMCAGKGSRLGALTENTPKCLLPVGGKPMIQWWLENFRKWEFSSVLINVCHMADKIIDFVRSKDWDIEISFVMEKEPLGTAKTLLKNKSFFEREDHFGVVYSDIWTTFDMRKLEQNFLDEPSMLTLGVHVPDTLKEKGFVEINEKENMVVGFEENPESPKSNLAWAGLLVADPFILDLISDEKDIGPDLFPNLVNKCVLIRSFIINEFLDDIGGSIEKYKEVDDYVHKYCKSK